VSGTEQPVSLSAPSVEPSAATSELATEFTDDQPGVGYSKQQELKLEEVKDIASVWCALQQPFDLLK